MIKTSTLIPLRLAPRGGTSIFFRNKGAITFIIGAAHLRDSRHVSSFIVKNSYIVKQKGYKSLIQRGREFSSVTNKGAMS